MSYTINEGPRVRITKVNFSGNNAFKAGKLRKIIKSKKKKFLVFSQYYSEKKVDMILNKQGTNICPFEKMVFNIENPREGYERIVKKLELLKQK